MVQVDVKLRAQNLGRGGDRASKKPREQRILSQITFRLYFASDHNCILGRGGHGVPFGLDQIAVFHILLGKSY